jgi:NAD(P)-dependent dehydrogenase (short-subunit alcohol dehydrogenase family)
MQKAADARLLEWHDGRHAAHYNGWRKRRWRLDDRSHGQDRACHGFDRRRRADGCDAARRGRSARPGAWPRRGARRLAAAVRQTTDRLDILINNAGIGTAGGTRQESADGFELRFAVNYLAGFLLTSLLLPLIKASAPARIVNVSSGGQQPIDFADVMLTRGYSGARAYCQSKLAQILFTIDLAEELRGAGVTVTCLHPATYMDTAMVRRAGIAPLSTVAEGAEAILNLATSPALAGRSGLYFNGLREARAQAQAYDAEARRRLRAISLELTGLSSDGSASAE